MLATLCEGRRSCRWEWCAKEGVRTVNRHVLSGCACFVTCDCAWQGDRRIVVTGMGIVSCLGNTLEEVSDSLHAAKPGIKFSEKYKEIGMKPC